MQAERRRRGRPPGTGKPAAEKSLAIKITLTPAALATLDALGGSRSGTIERLVMAAAEVR